MANTFKVKTISAEYSRKLNPELIIPKRTYESIQESLTLWADVEPGEDDEKAIRDLQLLVEERVAERLQDKVRRLREQRDFNGATPLLAVEAAFRNFFTGNFSDEPEMIDKAWAEFKNSLDAAAANLAAQ